jgi:hypothetical protein
MPRIKERSSCSFSAAVRLDGEFEDFWREAIIMSRTAFFGVLDVS